MSIYPSQALLDAMTPIADAVVKGFMTDFTRHDRQTILAAVPGDSFIWAPYELGTHLVPVLRNNVSMYNNKFLEAVISYPGVSKLYILELNIYKHIIAEVTAEQARNYVRNPVMPAGLLKAE